MDKMFIANRITELRLKKNVSEYQMSLDLGRNKSYIQSLSSGRNNPTMENFLETYSERIFSRISSNYTMLKLIGNDIRIQKKLLGGK